MKQTIFTMITTLNLLVFFVSCGDNSVSPQPPQTPENPQDADRNEHSAVGIENMGNTCYMNSVLQILSSSKAFTSCLNSAVKHNIFAKSNGDGNFESNNRQLFIQLNTIMKRLNGKDKNTLSGDVIGKLYRVLTAYEDSFFRPLADPAIGVYHEQQDAEEALSSLNNILENGSENFRNCILKGIYTQNQHSMEFLDRDGSLVTTSVTINHPELSFPLHIDNNGKNVVTDLIERELIDDVEFRPYEHDKNYLVNGRRTKRFIKSSLTFIPYIKRFIPIDPVNRIFEKNSSEVVFHEKISSSFLNKLAINNNIFSGTYQLRAFNCHSGGIEGGHWVSAKKNGTDKWEFISDGRVEGPYNSLNILLDKHDVCKTGSNILIYENE